MFRVWKGVVPQSVTLYQLPSIDMVQLEVGQTYAVFAQPLAPEHGQRLRLPEPLKGLVVPECSGAMNLDQELIRQLGRSRSPKQAG